MGPLLFRSDNYLVLRLFWHLKNTEHCELERFGKKESVESVSVPKRSSDLTFSQLFQNLYWSNLTDYRQYYFLQSGGFSSILGFGSIQILILSSWRNRQYYRQYYKQYYRILRWNRGHDFKSVETERLKIRCLR